MGRSGTDAGLPERGAYLYMARPMAAVAEAVEEPTNLRPMRRGRQYRRVTCKARALAGVSTGEVRSISKSGVFLATAGRIAAGAEVELDFLLPDGTPLSAVGCVSRVDAGISSGEPGLGIRFLRINIEALTAIERLAAVA